MTAAPPKSWSLPALGMRQGTAVLLGWLLVNLVLLAPLLQARGDAAGLAGPGLLGGRLGGILCLVGLAAFVVAWFTKNGTAFWFGVLAVIVQGCAWLLCRSPQPLSDGQWITAFLGLHALMQIPLFFFVSSSAAVPDRHMVWIMPLVVAAEVLVALLMPEAWRAGWLVLSVSYLLVLVLQLIGAERQGRASRAELEAAFELRQQRQTREVQARERSRIMRELHDGLGSPLVAASALLSTAQPANRAAADLIDLCLQELRGTIDVLGADFRDVGELLGSFRDRMEPVLEARGIALDWQVQPLLSTARLDAGERLHVMRIVQEAFTNVLKHSGASQVILRAETLASGCSVIDIIDNGGGLRPGAALAPGWGLSNMHDRAALLGAQLSCTDGETGGVHVRLALHCTAAEASPPCSGQPPRHA